MALQSTWSDTVTAGYPGMVANGETSNRITRSIEDSGGIGFGKAAYRGSGDHGCTATQTLSGSATAGGSNTGNGTMGTITVSAGAKPGTYSLVITEPGSNAGKFEVRDPDGEFVGTGTVASAFSGGGLAFTLADGATDFISGDYFTIAVSGGQFLGITIATSALGLISGQTADTYPQYENVPIMTRGTIWVTAGGSVTDGSPVQVDSNGDYVTSGGIPLPGWVFDTTGADDAVVKITRR